MAKSILHAHTRTGIILILIFFTTAAAYAQESEYVNELGMEFTLIQPGTFKMGSENGRENERPVHSVEITKAFYMGKYEVTQSQWETVMGSNPSKFREKGGNHPVESVSWDDVQLFLKKLNAGSDKYRLPTEAEWEYAARAGTSSKFSFGNDPSQLDAYAWYNNNSNGETHPVGTKRPNPWGLYDIHGNVLEWVNDFYGEVYYKTSAVRDPKGVESDKRRVLRGGAYLNNDSDLRSARRSGINAGNRFFNIGFRVVWVP